MEKQISAYQFKSVYEDLGYDIGKLGCIMLDVEPEDLEKQVLETIKSEEVFQSDDPTDHIHGIEAGNPHVTLLYGLLRSGPEMQKHVMTVLNDGNACPSTVWIDWVDYFESPKPDKPYYCIVAHLVVTPELQECNDRLKLLPHISTFSGYKAHMTLAYIKQDAKVRDRVVEQLNVLLRGRILPVKGLNFGD